MQVEMPFYEGPEDALKAAVQALGGSKKVGALLWPDKSIDAASRLLLDCINPSRAEKLEITQYMRIFKLARERGFHGPYQWFSLEIGYEASPIEPEDERAKLQRDYINAVQQLTRLTQKMEAIV